VSESAGSGSRAPGSAGAAHPDLGELLLGEPGVEAFLTAVARLAAGEVPAALDCGLTVQVRPDVRPWSATSGEFARRMDAVQYEVDDGPCLTCLRLGAPVEVGDISADERWSEYRARGIAEGVAASLSIPLSVGADTMGALNLYARTPHAFTDADRERAGQLAQLAAGAVRLALLLAEREHRSRHLETALTSRSTIDQALGILMGRHQITAAEAFDVLRRRSQLTNTKLRDVAAGLVAGAGADRGRDTPRPGT
jgi:GAF domain-containing protein